MASHVLQKGVPNNCRKSAATAATGRRPPLPLRRVWLQEAQREVPGRWNADGPQGLRNYEFHLWRQAAVGLPRTGGWHSLGFGDRDGEERGALRDAPD
eukprot:16428761-Heterocapsa_arctica.AAC.1